MSIQSRRLNQFFLSSKDTKIQELFLNRTVIYELILQGFVFFYQRNESTKITINTWFNGCLGSHNDEERSEMRYVMRIAKSVSHQNFERNLPFLGRMSVGVSVHPHTSSPFQKEGELRQPLCLVLVSGVNVRRCNTPPTSPLLCWS